MDYNIDSHKLMYHPERVTEWLKNEDCFPIYVEVGLTNRCNHRCKFCALDFLEHGGHNLDTGLMTSTLKDMSKSGVKSIMFAGEGEPLLHKSIGDFVKIASQEGVDTSITTNGVALNERKREQCLPYLSWIRFSIDSGDAKTYAWVHGTEQDGFEKVITNIRNCVQYKREHKLQTTIGIQTLALSESLSSLENLAQIAIDIGVDNLQIKPYSHHPLSKNDFSISYGEWVKIGADLKKHEKSGFRVIHREETMKRLNTQVSYNQCYGLPFIALIDSRGNVIPCNLFYNSPEFSYGNLYDNSFSEIWGGKKRKEVLKKIREKGVDECRGGCRLDTINRYLNRLKNPELHDNFI